MKLALTRPNVLLMFCILYLTSNLKILAGRKDMCHVIGGISSEINTENGRPDVNYYFRYHDKELVGMSEGNIYVCFIILGLNICSCCFQT